MDLAQTLVRSVMRAFYETRHILVIDALIIHSALRDDDMAYLMGMNTKDLHKLCGKLREDRFLAVHTRPELKEGQTRPVNRTYYYIDYRQTIDAIKWRVYKIDKDMQGTAVPASERKEYFCNFCKAAWTQMEVLDNVSSAGFLCHRCGHVLEHDADRNSVGHQQSTRMNNQFKFITDLLPQIDSVVVPDNTFDAAYSNARPVHRADTHRVVQSVAVESNRPTAVKGMANTGPKSMQVSISTADGLSEGEKAAERERKERIAKQNALPSWMSNSTITGESFQGDTATTGAGLVLPKEEVDIKAVEKQLPEVAEQSAIDELYAQHMAQLKAETEAEAARKAAAAAAAAAEGSDDDEDDGDFEDVLAISTNSISGTPASTAAAAISAVGAVPFVPSPLRQSSVPSQSSLKREAPGSGTSTGMASPIGASTPGSDDRPVKKVKVEAPSLPPPGGAEDGEDGEDDEDLEFEDV